MKKRFSIDRIGTRGSIVLLILGILCLSFGIHLQMNANNLPSEALECTATIDRFSQTDATHLDIPYTIVTYTVGGMVYTGQILRQYEASWRPGDQIRICCNPANPTHIWTRTMQYRGVFYIIFSVSFLLVSIYKLVQFRRIKGVNDDESDIDESGEEKFKISSFIIPFAAGIPFTVAGVMYWMMERSFFAVVIVAVDLHAQAGALQF